MIAQVQQVFRQLDIFGQSITLSFRQQEKYRTSIGGFLSLSLIGIVISFFYQNIISFFDMTSVTSSLNLTFKNDPAIINLDPERFMFAVQIEQNNFINNPYFNITLEQRHYERFDNGTQYRYPYQYVDLVQCTLEHFKPLFDKYNVSIEEQFITLNLSNFLCPNIQQIQNLTLGGSWKSKNYYFLKFSVSICLNDSINSLSWKPRCKSSDEVTQAISQQGSFRFQLYQTNFLINPDNPNTFAEPYLSTETFYSFVPKTMFVQSDIFLRSKTVNTDRGILMYPDIQEEIFPFREFGDERQQISLNSLSQTQYGAFYLNASPYKYIINRAYMRLDELLSYLGGFSQFMIVIIGIFASLYNREHLKIQMANDLYEFEMNLTKGSPTQQPLSHMNRSVIRKAESIGQMPEYCQNIEKQNLKTNNQIIIDDENYQRKIINTNQTVIEKQGISIKQMLSTYFEDFKKYVQQKYRVRIGVRMFLSSLLPFDCVKTDDSFVVEKAINQVKKELDIEYIIKQIHEIQKLKKILFNHEQIILFNFTQKPIIALYKDSQMRRRTKIITLDQENLMSTKDMALLKQFTDLVQSYQFALKEMKDDQSHYNSRLLALLGIELQKILEKEIQSQNNQQVITEGKELQ